MKKNLLLVLSGAALLFSCGGGDKPVGSKVKVSVNVDNTQDASVVLGSEEAVVGTDFTTILTLKKNSNADWKLSFDLKSVKSGTHDLTPHDYKYAPATDYSKADFGLAGSKIYGDVVITISLTQEERPTPTGWHEITDEKGIEIANKIANHNINNLPLKMSSKSNFDISFGASAKTYEDCVSNWDANKGFQMMDSPYTTNGSIELTRSYMTHKGVNVYSMQKIGDEKLPATITPYTTEDAAAKAAYNNVMNGGSKPVHYDQLVQLQTIISASTEHKLMSKDDNTSLYVYTNSSYSSNGEVKLTYVYENYLITKSIQDVNNGVSHIVGVTTNIDYESEIEIPEEAQNPEEWPTE